MFTVLEVKKVGTDAKDILLRGQFHILRYLHEINRRLDGDTWTPSHKVVHQSSRARRYRVLESTIDLFHRKSCNHNSNLQLIDGIKVMNDISLLPSVMSRGIWCG